MQIKLFYYETVKKAYLLAKALLIHSKKKVGIRICGDHLAFWGLIPYWVSSASWKAHSVCPSWKVIYRCLMQIHTQTHTYTHGSLPHFIHKN